MSSRRRFRSWRRPGVSARHRHHRARQLPAGESVAQVGVDEALQVFWRRAGGSSPARQSHPSGRPTCQMKGRWWKRLACCSKNFSRSQTSRPLPAQSASASSLSSTAGFQLPGCTVSQAAISSLSRRSCAGASPRTGQARRCRRRRCARPVSRSGQSRRAGLGQPVPSPCRSRPAAVACQAGDGDFAGGSVAGLVTVEQPLGGVVRDGLGEPFG